VLEKLWFKFYYIIQEIKEKLKKGGIIFERVLKA